MQLSTPHSDHVSSKCFGSYAHSASSLALSKGNTIHLAAFRKLTIRNYFLATSSCQATNEDARMLPGMLLGLAKK